jgi:hypothetical protein
MLPCDQDHKPKFINPPDRLKKKVGSGGLGKDVLEKAESMIQTQSSDFRAMADDLLLNLYNGISQAETYDREVDDLARVKNAIIYPAMELKANGSMFHCALVTDIAEKLVNFTEELDRFNDDALEIVFAFYTTLQAILSSQLIGNSGHHGDELVKALENACQRYYYKYMPEALSDEEKGEPG